MSSYVMLGLVALAPAVAAAILFLLEEKTAYGKLGYWVKQVVAGIIFGAIAIYGTEKGIPIAGAVVNARDGAVLTAGLIFGGPAGIIAGLLGGIERWIAVAWGVGSFTRVACSVSTALAGFYAAAIKKFMFDNKKPGWALSLAIGIVMEVFHLTMVFVTNPSESERAIAVIKACTLPMVIANALAVMLSVMVVSVLTGEGIRLRSGKRKISESIQKWLLVVVVFAFVITTSFMYLLQKDAAMSAAEEKVTLAVEDAIADVEDSSNRSLFDEARVIVEDLKTTDIFNAAFNHNVAEIHVIDKDGIIVETNILAYLDFDMKSGEQSREFMCLTEGVKEYSQKLGPISANPDVERKYVGVATDDGFVQIGYDESSIELQLGNEIIYAAKNKHVGKNGFIVVANSARRIVSAPDHIDAPDIKSLVPIIQTAKDMPQEGVMFRTEVNGVDSFCRYELEEGFYVFAFYPVDEAMQSRDIAVYANVFMQVLVFAILFALVYLLIMKVVVAQITKVNGSLEKIRGGNLDEIVNARRNYEFAHLSDDINATVDTLKHYIDEAAARIDADLKMAKEIQASALPSVFPAFPKRPDFDIYARMDTAKEVGGDFYDFYMTDYTHLHILIADVSGKGIPAAMFMMRAKTQLASLTKSGAPIDEVFSKGSDALCEGNDAGMFVTAWQGGFDFQYEKFVFANGGHNPPLIKRADGKFEYFKSKVNLVLAGMEGAPYMKQEVEFHEGDTIFLYTDGVTEATDAHNELYGEDRLLAILNSREFTDMKDLCDTVKADVDKFVAEAPQFDDITMVAFKYFG